MATENKDFRVKNGLVVGGIGTFDGTVTVATPTLGTHAATKDYVDLFAGGGSLTVSPTPPELPEEGDLWFNSTDGSTYVYYDSFWVEATSAYAGPAGNVIATTPLSFNEQTSVLSIDLSSYYTTDETDSAISDAINAIPPVSFDGYATETYVNLAVAAVDLTPVQSQVDNLEIATIMGVY